jgi:hypothetical protein
MSKSNKNLNKNQEAVNMENVKTEVNVEEQKGFFGRMKDRAIAHKNVLIAGAVGMGLGVFAGVSMSKRNHENDSTENDGSYDEMETIDDVECLELMKNDNMSNENEEVVE